MFSIWKHYFLIMCTLPRSIYPHVYKPCFPNLYLYLYQYQRKENKSLSDQILLKQQDFSHILCSSLLLTEGGGGVTQPSGSELGNQNIQKAKLSSLSWTRKQQQILPSALRDAGLSCCNIYIFHIHHISATHSLKGCEIRCKIPLTTPSPGQQDTLWNSSAFVHSATAVASVHPTQPFLTEANRSHTYLKPTAINSPRRRWFGLPGKKDLKRNKSLQDDNLRKKTSSESYFIAAIYISSKIKQW